MNLDDWARTWGVSAEAMRDLNAQLGALDYLPPIATGKSEAAVQAAVRAQASRYGMRLWRNNVGVDPENHVRYGLANDSSQLNAIVKSADLIGIRKRLIAPEDVGTLIGQFVSFECKHGAWKWSGTEREIAQRNWAAIITAWGGEARFVTGPEQV